MNYPKVNISLHIKSPFGRCFGLLFLLLSFVVKAQINWPEGQLLPSFPAPAATQDLIYMNGSVPTYYKSWTWQAEGTELSHATGTLESDGWLCQTGVSEA
ncbi:MAG: hypothetical protein VB066_03130, partial [Paludibacter sp.]|nr:hypothetical protein [Paludibacter sp.]